MRSGKNTGFLIVLISASRRPKISTEIVVKKSTRRFSQIPSMTLGKDSIPTSILKNDSVTLAQPGVETKPMATRPAKTRVLTSATKVDFRLLRTRKARLTSSASDGWCA